MKLHYNINNNTKRDLGHTKVYSYDNNNETKGTSAEIIREFILSKMDKNIQLFTINQFYN